eukprot:CAMPEP_0178962414 /NCGR_PEP_ID=MMETSP0789-20121207/14347_1 /TAXON_ID=3005 /ORGANISM="Rhizosolenia setigera, Strain CCMP 1694" /LENGTH=260 /DNA_ID=CAMNT_0020646553 /DNA_START=52 /DNA_END=834 /DNA_ORIENTATION=-
MCKLFVFWPKLYVLLFMLMNEAVRPAAAFSSIRGSFLRKNLQDNRIINIHYRAPYQTRPNSSATALQISPFTGVDYPNFLLAYEVQNISFLAVIIYVGCVYLSIDDSTIKGLGKEEDTGDQNTIDEPTYPSPSESKEDTKSESEIVIENEEVEAVLEMSMEGEITEEIPASKSNISSLRREVATDIKKVREREKRLVLNTLSNTNREIKKKDELDAELEPEPEPEPVLEEKEESSPKKRKRKRSILRRIITLNGLIGRKK